MIGRMADKIQILPHDEELEELLYDYVNSYSGLPSGLKVIKSEKLDATPPSIMMKIASNSEIATSFIGGSYIGRLRFGIFYKTNAKDTRTTLDGFKILRDINKWFIEQEKLYISKVSTPPVLGTNNKYDSIEMTMTPQVTDELENGELIYVAHFQLLYLHT